MKHAGPQALDRLRKLLDELRALPALREKSPGIFYFRSRPFLHFHDDPAGLFADLRTGGEFERQPVNSPAEQAHLLRAVRAHVG